MVATCIQCGAALTIADLGDAYCQNCHWQQVFEDAPGAVGELRLTLYQRPGGPAHDRRGRIWQSIAGDEHTWCVLCGATVGEGWMQGPPDGLEIYICTDHVDLVADLTPRRPDHAS
jgi:hypothetical protein